MTRRGQVTPSATGNYDVRLSITVDEHSHLRQVQALLGHAVPSGDPAEIYARAMKHYLAHLEKQRFGVKPGAAASAAGARGLPKPLRRLVWERDGARCTFMSRDGHRCEETGRLEVDHITPVAMGGKATPENLRLLCSSHNAHEAERMLGKEHMQRYAASASMPPRRSTAPNWPTRRRTPRSKRACGWRWPSSRARS